MEFKEDMIGKVEGAGWICNICKRPMNEKRHLKAHIERKHIVAQYLIQCKLCSKICTHEANMGSHLRRAHKLAPGKKSIRANCELIINPELTEVDGAPKLEPVKEIMLDDPLDDDE